MNVCVVNPERRIVSSELKSWPRSRASLKSPDLTMHQVQRDTAVLWVSLRGIASLVTITSEGDFSELTLRLLIGPEMMDVAC